MTQLTMVLVVYGTAVTGIAGYALGRLSGRK